MSLRVLTFNVFFDTTAQHLRSRALLEIARSSAAHVLLFQEVTRPFLRELQATDWVVRDFACSDADYTGATFDDYGVVSLARRDLSPSFKVVPMRSRMDRELLITAIDLPVEDSSGAGPAIAKGRPQRALIGNVHLESLNSHPIRVQQLHTCRAALAEAAAAAREAGADAPLTILAGDFNFCSYRNFVPSLPLENDDLAVCLPGWLDVWEALKDASQEPGYTFDTELNAFTEAMGCGRYERMRYDRVMALVSGPTGGGVEGSVGAGVAEGVGQVWAPTDIRLVGTEQVPLEPSDKPTGQDGHQEQATGSAGSTSGLGIPGKTPLSVDCSGLPRCVFPSDHFGLLATFTLGAAMPEPKPPAQLGRGVALDVQWNAFSDAGDAAGDKDGMHTPPARIKAAPGWA